MTGWIRDVAVDPEWRAIDGLSISPCRSFETGQPETRTVSVPPGNDELRMYQLFPGPDRINIVSVTHPR